ncbi:hypothetical protein EU527_08110 [Candidatus Thorarchaeota archaeon]|nr:MAG: hypothetical protein EU527_08110 [Candidatus Thorarchaeota archaeon]
MSKNDIRSPVNLKLASMTDLARMLVSWSQRDRPASMLYFEHKGKHIYGTLISNHGYYEHYGLPLWVHAEGDGPPEGNYLSYSTRPKEKIAIVDSYADSEPMTAFLPIIRLAEKLEILDI